MSIKRVWIDKLKNEFLLSTEKYKLLADHRSELCEKMKKIIEDYSIQEIPPEEFKVLRNLSDFWETTRFYPGTSFRDVFGGNQFDPEVERYFGYWYGVELKVTKPFYEKCYDSLIYRLGKLPPEVLPELIKINNEILDIDYKRTYLNKSWDRLINPRVKKTWLKINFPEIYKQLKKYETGISV